MTPYFDEDALEKWEFKITRSGTGAFGNSEKLRTVLEEEARAGWDLVEKFDNQRVRLRRPVAARGDDHTLDVDPYRSWIGVSEAGMAVRGLLVSGLIGAVVLIIVLFQVF